MNINEINEAFDREYEIHSKDPVYRIIRACGLSTANSDINVFALEKIIEDIKTEERERIKQENQRCYVFNPDGTYQGSGGGGRPRGEGGTK